MQLRKKQESRASNHLNRLPKIYDNSPVSCMARLGGGSQLAEKFCDPVMVQMTFDDEFGRCHDHHTLVPRQNMPLA
ncbi:hypothetical protein XAC3562_1570009 [Xanthomonas citri pv. citri]|uniref:Uncharacterized protein n=1 Tax=Xanthomonas citri pv. citri TaxID=611301 RepID=A0A0U5FB36_XANCI|nr:hypothetical protein XAC3562_1570009 [Xanthomonas citri pv. citri]CEH58349.1 hypothetical protein XACLD7_3370003 [Xanthomonas citri pv. citri]CEH84744.1 hypothetical protein XAC3612_3140003 [Xanthomonas citri pv. citri]CEJ21681.1 hypothetical protein XACE116_12470003 [Xanthomonas citri pv. citri]CEJ26271.1 hypothetical protein XACE116_12470003 [Xanthomonas citri pv. citri]